MTMSDVKLTYEHSETLDLFLALQRDLMGRFSWEASLVPIPVVPRIAQFREGIRSWQAGGLDGLPAWIASAKDPREFADHLKGDRLREAARRIEDGLRAASPIMRPTLRSLEGHRVTAEADLDRLLPLDRLEGPLRAALGVEATPLALPLYLVTLAPNSPGAGFLMEGERLASAYIDCKRFTGPTLADGVLTLLAWALLKEPSGSGNLSSELAARLPGRTPYHRRLRAITTKILVEITSGHLVSGIEPRHRPCVDVLGTAWRYPRLYAVAARHWESYLSGLTGREQAMSAMTHEIRQWSPRWYVDHVDAASLAADFYLLEWLGADGDTEAVRRFATWLPRLAHYFARQLDLIIGAELGHYERARSDTLAAPLAAFLGKVTTGDSRVAWPRTRAELGQIQALDLATEAFAGPGAEYGGEAWAPVAAMMGRYVRHELSHAVFVDQCFTLEHNNGSLFDKYFETENVLRVLDAQAAGELDTLAEHASPEVRHRWNLHRRRRFAGHDPRWLGVRSDPPEDHVRHDETGGVASTVQEAPPGSLGCGSSEDREAIAPGVEPDQMEPVRVRRQVFKGTRRDSLQRYAEARATLHTALGEVALTLWPALAPHTVDNFVQLARGSGRWLEPATGAAGSGAFYDGTGFHRRVPEFLIQGGDRLNTGEGGPGYRIPDEIWPEARFDRPFIMAMANTGPNSTGSQFFITLAPLEQLNGLFTQFGEVADAASREVVLAIARAEAMVTLRSVAVSTRL